MVLLKPSVRFIYIFSALSEAVLEMHSLSFSSLLHFNTLFTGNPFVIVLFRSSYKVSVLTVIFFKLRSDFVKFPQS